MKEINAAVFLLIVLLLPVVSGESWMFPMMIIGFGYALVYGSISIPVYLKFGVQKSRYISFILLVLSAGVYGVTFGFGMYLEFTASVIPLLIGVIAVSLVVFCLSYQVSKRIYAKKGF